MLARLKHKLFPSPPQSDAPATLGPLPINRLSDLQPAVKVVMLHSATTGQSSISRRVKDHAFRVNEPITVGVDFAVWPTVECRFQVWDVSWMDRFYSVARTYMRGLNIALLTFDLTNRQSMLDLQSHKDELERQAPWAPIILVGTKSDLVARREVDRDQAKEFARHIGAEEYVEFSAKHAIGVNELLDAMDRAHGELVIREQQRAAAEAQLDAVSAIQREQEAIAKIRANKTQYLNQEMFSSPKNLARVLKGLSSSDTAIILDEPARVFCRQNRKKFIRTLDAVINNSEFSDHDRVNYSQLVRGFIADKDIKWRHCSKSIKRLVHLQPTPKFKQKPRLIRTTAGQVITLEEAIAILVKNADCLDVKLNADDIGEVNKLLGKVKRYRRQCVIEINDEHQLIDLTKLPPKQKRRFSFPENIKRKITCLAKQHRHLGRYKTGLMEYCHLQSLRNGDEFPLERPRPQRFMVTEDGYGIDVDALLRQYAEWPFIEHPYTKQPFTFNEQQQLLRFVNRTERVRLQQKSELRNRIDNRNNLPTDTNPEQIVFVANAYGGLSCFNIENIIVHCVETKTLSVPGTNVPLAPSMIIALNNHPLARANQELQNILSLRRRLDRAVNCQHYVALQQSGKAIPLMDLVFLRHTDNSIYVISKNECIDFIEQTTDLLSPYQRQPFSSRGIGKLIDVCRQAKRYDLAHKIVMQQKLQHCVNKEQFMAAHPSLASMTPFDLIISEDNYACTRQELMLKKNPYTDMALMPNDSEQLHACSGMLIKLQRCSNGDAIMHSTNFMTTRPWEEIVILPIDQNGAKRSMAFLAHELFDSIETTGFIPGTDKPATPQQMRAILGYQIDRWRSANNVNSSLAFDAADVVNEVAYSHVPLFCVPTSSLFFTANKPIYGFDVNELLTDFEKNGRLINGYTREFFAREDQQVLCKHANLRCKVLNLIARVEAQQNTITPEVLTMVKRFAVEYYFNSGSGTSSGVALTNFKCNLNNVAQAQREHLYNYLIIDSDKMQTFAELMTRIESGAVCAHATSRMLWKFINDLDGDYISQCSSGRYVYGYADIRAWQQDWARESSSNEQRLAQLGIDVTVWRDHNIYGDRRWFKPVARSDVSQSEIDDRLTEKLSAEPMPGLEPGMIPS